MKLRAFIIGGLLLAAVVCILSILHPPSKERRALARTQRDLHRQGFKLGLDEFNFSAPAELRDRAQVLTNALAGSAMMLPLQARAGIDLMPAISSNSALVVWKQPGPASTQGHELWGGGPPQTSEPDIAAALAAVLSGPFRFELNPAAGASMMLPHLASLKMISQWFSQRAMLDLHEGRREAAWTNTLATARVATAWETEPVEISILVRYACLDTAFDTIWQTLQAGGWPDERLAKLQHEFEPLDLLKALPETIAFSRASSANLCERERADASRWGMPLNQMLHQPRFIWPYLTNYWRQSGYRSHGSYEEENEILLFYRDREVEMRNALQHATWAEMAAMPGITNAPFLRATSNFSSRTRAMMNLRQMQMAFGGGLTLAARAAVAETKRRLLVTAIALERFHRRNGSYPETLAALTPEVLPQPAVDFMDGRPFRYQRTDDGHFVLYSVGLKGVDHGGSMDSPAEAAGMARTRRTRFGLSARRGTDIVWPRPATDAEVDAWEDAQRKKAEALDLARIEQVREAQEEFERNRIHAVTGLLASPAYKKTTWQGGGDDSREPVCNGRPVRKLLQNSNGAGTNSPTLDELFTLQPVLTGAEPEIITYQLPVRYDVLTNLDNARLSLVMDTPAEGEPMAYPDLGECRRATNGDCLLSWNTTLEGPGPHALQAVFACEFSMEKLMVIKGPVIPYFSSNLCRFFGGNRFFSSHRPLLYALLPEPEGTYRIELKTGAGAHVRTFTGRTTDGIVSASWDHRDEAGRKCTNDVIESFFTITLPDGRSQTLKQPQNQLPIRENGFE